MKRAVIILAVLVLLLMPAALAVKEAKVSGWYSYYDSFSFNGDEYSLKVINGEYVPEDEAQNTYAGVLRIGRNDEKYLISLGECHKNINHSYCFVNKSFDREEVDIDSQGRLQPAIQVELIEYDYSSAVTITRVFETTKFALYVPDSLHQKILLDGISYITRCLTY